MATYILKNNEIKNEKIEKEHWKDKYSDKLELHEPILQM